MNPIEFCSALRLWMVLGSAASVLSVSAGGTESLPRFIETGVSAFRLLDAGSVREALGDTRTTEPIDAIGILRGVMVQSRADRDYLVLVQHPGARIDEFAEFWLLEAPPEGLAPRQWPDPPVRFETTRGLSLGSKKKDVARILGPAHRRETMAGGVEDVWTYQLSRPHPFLERQKAVGYKVYARFQRDGLAELRFGFEYP